MKPSFLLLTASIVFLLLISCDRTPAVKPTDPPFDQVPFYPMHEDFLTWFAVPDSGSWYIYQDSASGVYDTTIVPKKMNIGGQVSLWGGAISPIYKSEDYWTFYDCQLSHDFSLRISAKEDKFYFEVLYTSGASHSFWMDTTENYSTLDWIDFYDSVEIAGKTYRDVIALSDHGLHYDRLWFARSVGIVLKESKHGAWDSTFYLIEYGLK